MSLNQLGRAIVPPGGHRHHYDVSTVPVIDQGGSSGLKR